MGSAGLTIRVTDRWRWMIASLVLAVCLVPLSVFAQDEGAADQPVDEVPVEVVPTDPPPPPPTEPPPPPTAVPSLPPPTPEPTAVPPTEVPTATEIPVNPTEIPVVPTEEPVDPTEVPTETPTPSPTPTPAPAIPFVPVVTCDLIEGGALPVAGESAWSFQDCTVTWETENVSAVELQAWTEAAGWQAIAVSANALGNHELLDSSDGLLNLSDSNQGGEGFTSSRFYLGTRLGCTSSTASGINLDLTATSTAPVSKGEDGNPLSDEPGETVIETANLRDLSLDGRAASAPSVSVESVTFTSISPIAGPQVSTGTIRIGFAGAPACGWQADVRFSDFDGDGSGGGLFSLPEGTSFTVSADFLATATISGPPGASISGGSGDYTISILSSADTPSTGVLTLTVSLDLPGPIFPGSYTTTVFVSTSIDP